MALTCLSAWLAGLTGCGAVAAGGTGSASVGNLAVSTSNVLFGTVAVGESASSTVTLSNSGGTALQITQMSVNGSSFSLTTSGTLPMTLAAGASYSVKVQFSPKAAGAASGQLTVTTDATTGDTALVSLSGTGQATSSGGGGSTQDPNLTISTTSVDFGGVTVNTASTRSITLTSSGSTAVTINAAVVAGTGFSISTPNLPVTLNPQQSATLTVKFDPASAASFTGTLEISSNASNAAKIQVVLGGTGLANSSGGQQTQVPDLTVSATNLAFGDVTVSTALRRSITLTSSGSAPVTIGAVAVTGTGFSVSAPHLPVTLNPQQTATLTLQFDPASASLFNGLLEISSNASSGATKQVALSGTGTTAIVLNRITCSGSTLVGAATDTCTVMLSGPAPSGGVSVQLASSSSSVAVPASLSIAAGASSGSFTASAAQVTAAEKVTISARSGSVSASYGLQLEPLTRTLQVQSTSIGFGSTNLNSGITQSLTLTSTGTASLTISAATVTGAGFRITGMSLPATLNPGQATTIELEFDPTAAGAATGVLTISSNADGGSATKIGLSGTGTSTSYSVQLNWGAPASSGVTIAGYKVYREENGGTSYAELNSSPISATDYTDTNVQSGKAYSYYVVSVDGSGNSSGPSNIFSATIP